jgi:hypothetical protein
MARCFAKEIPAMKSVGGSRGDLADGVAGIGVTGEGVEPLG